MVLDIEVMKVGLEMRNEAKTTTGKYESKMNNTPPWVVEDLKRQGLWPIKSTKK